MSEPSAEWKLEQAERELAAWIAMDIPNDRRALHRVVMGALRQCIAEHGPITERWVDSAAKRIAGQVRGYRRQEIRALRSGARPGETT